MSAATKCPFHDAFAEQRKQGDAMPINFEGEELTMLLSYEAVRDAARNFKSFSSDAPFRVPIPSEENVRTIRQLPIETDPPEHSAYVRLIKPYFRRPREEYYIDQVEDIIRAQLKHAIWVEEVEVVRELGLPLQCQALTLLLNVDESEADEWIGWGIHVFNDGDGEEKGSSLEDYIHRKLDEAEAAPPRDDFFSAMAHGDVNGRKLTRDEMVGYINLAFAGGRDTIIQSVALMLALCADRPDLLDRVRADDAIVEPAVEEFFRMSSVLTHIGRVNVCEGDVHGVPTPADRRISLCWASANFDEKAFVDADVYDPERSPNRHIAFGTGPHQCAGVDHARAIMRTLLRLLAEMQVRVEVLDAEENVESHNDYERRTGYERLVVRLSQE